MGTVNLDTFISDVVEELYIAISCDATAVKFFENVQESEFHALNKTHGMSIRNEFKLHKIGILPEGVCPEATSLAIISALSERFKSECVPSDTTLIEELDGSEFELSEYEPPSNANSHPMSDETISQMKSMEWMHQDSQQVYVILHITNNAATIDKRADYPVTIVYQNTETGDIWSKPIERFLKSMVRTYE